MIRAVFLDIDNTLLSFDGYVEQALREGLPRFGICDYRDGMSGIFHSVNNALWCSLERGEITYPELYGQRFNRIFEAMGVSGDGPEFERYFREKLRESAVIMDGAEDIVRYLSGKYILCAASNGPYEQQKNRLKIAGMLPYFHHLFISEDIGASKPDIVFYSRAVERLEQAGYELKRDECVMIGDSLTSDMAGGIAYGMRTVYYDLRGIGSTGDLKPDHIIRNLSEIKNIL